MKSILSTTLIKCNCLLILSILMLGLSQCKPSDGSTSGNAATTSENASSVAGGNADFMTEQIPGTQVQRVHRKNQVGLIVEEGFMSNGVKTGMWTTYGNENEVSSVKHYVNGKLEGPALTLSFRSQVEQRENYRQDKLHGPWYSYKFGRLTEERHYVNGQLEGMVRTYDDRTFKIKQEAEYKNGVLDGTIRYYNEDGKVTLEYVYKNGEKVSGGIVE